MKRGMNDFGLLLVVVLLLIFTLVIYFLIKGGLENVLK